MNTLSELEVESTCPVCLGRDIDCQNCYGYGLVKSMFEQALENIRIIVARAHKE